MSFRIHKYTFFMLAIVLGNWLPGQVAAQEAETVELLPAERMLESAVTDLKEAMGEALRKNTQIGEKNDALRRDLDQHEQEMASWQEERDTLLKDQKVLRDALKVQDEDRNALLKDLDALRKEGESHDGSRAEKEIQITVLGEKQKRLQEEAQLLKEEVAFFQKRLQQKSAQPLPRGREGEKKDLEARRDALRDAIERKKEAVLKLQKKIASQKERAEELKSRKSAWLPKLAEIQDRLSEAGRDLEEIKQQRDIAGLKDKAALTAFQDDVARLRKDKERLEKIFAEVQDLQDVVRVASRQQEKQMAFSLQVLTEEAALLRKKKQALEETLSLRGKVASSDQEPCADSRDVSRKQLMADMDDLNLSLRKGQLKIRTYRKKEKLLLKDIVGLKVDYQKALKRQESSPSAAEIKEELSRLLADIDFEEAPEGGDLASAGEEDAPRRPAPFSKVQTLKRDVEALQLREAVLTSSLAIIQARYEEERKAVENFYQEETRLNEYLKVLRREHQGLEEKVGGLLKAQEKVARP